MMYSYKSDFKDTFQSSQSFGNSISEPWRRRRAVCHRSQRTNRTTSWKRRKRRTRQRKREDKTHFFKNEAQTTGKKGGKTNKEPKWKAMISTSKSTKAPKKSNVKYTPTLIHEEFVSESSDSEISVDHFGESSKLRFGSPVPSRAVLSGILLLLHGVDADLVSNQTSYLERLVLENHITKTTKNIQKFTKTPFPKCLRSQKLALPLDAAENRAALCGAQSTWCCHVSPRPLRFSSRSLQFHSVPLDSLLKIVEFINSLLKRVLSWQVAS